MCGCCDYRSGWGRVSAANTEVREIGIGHILFYTAITSTVTQVLTVLTPLQCYLTLERVLTFFVYLINVTTEWHRRGRHGSDRIGMGGE